VDPVDPDPDSDPQHCFSCIQGGFKIGADTRMIPFSRRGRVVNSADRVNTFSLYCTGLNRLSHTYDNMYSPERMLRRLNCTLGRYRPISCNLDK
jgi:hypothetical protein